jgi:hypothetical protein
MRPKSLFNNDRNNTHWLFSSWEERSFQAIDEKEMVDSTLLKKLWE